MKKWMILLLSFGLLCASSLSAWAWEASGETLYAGIDVSVWQGEIDFAQVAADGVEVVYIRAGEGSDYTDPDFADNYQAAQENGLLVGFYHYLTATSVDEARTEAQFFASLVEGLDYDCRLAMDYESFASSSVTTINAIALAYLETLEAATGEQPIVYSDLSNARNIFGSALSGYPLWIAEYGVETPADPGAWQSWVGFQYSSTGSVAGIDGHVDLDYFTDGVLRESAPAGGGSAGGGTDGGSGDGSTGTDGSGDGTGAGGSSSGNGSGGTDAGTDDGTASPAPNWLMMGSVAMVALTLVAQAVTAALREWRERQTATAAPEEGPTTQPGAVMATVVPLEQPLPYDLGELAQREVLELQEHRQREFAELQTLQQERERRELERLEQLEQTEIQTLVELQQQALARQQGLWSLREQIIPETQE